MEDVTMNRAKTISVFFMFAILIFFAAQSAMAGCSTTPGYDPLDPDPQAPGTKYVGPLTVYENDDGEICWFIRLRKGSSLYSYAACGMPTQDQDNFPFSAIELIKTYFNTDVIPDIYQCGPKTPQSDEIEKRSCPEAKLKSYDQDVSYDDRLTDFDSLRYLIMDITVAVQD
jgi:hypothetical protein